MSDRDTTPQSRKKNLQIENGNHWNRRNYNDLDFLQVLNVGEKSDVPSLGMDLSDRSGQTTLFLGTNNTKGGGGGGGGQVIRNKKPWKFMVVLEKEEKKKPW